MTMTNFINKNRKTIVPIRIREARISRGLSLSELAEIIGVTKQAVSKYELGTLNVNSSTLIKISEALDFPINFFFKIKESEDENYKKTPVFYRSISTPKKIKDTLEQKIEFVHEIMNVLRKYIDFPKVDMLNEDIDVSNGFLDNETIENIALKLREYWGLGTGPIKNLTNLLLKKGFVISRVELDTFKVDAYSRCIQGIPYIILGSDKDTAVRARFSLAHELGHIILHQHLEEEDLKKNHKQIEEEANRFASAFLMPAESFSKDIYSTSLDDFLILKPKWKVSIGAMIRRCYDLNLITDIQYSNMNRYLNMKKWKIREPLDDKIEFERPNMIKEAFDILIENGILSADDIVNLIALNPKEIEKLCFLEENYLSNYIIKSSKPKLRLIK